MEFLACIIHCSILTVNTVTRSEILQQRYWQKRPQNPSEILGKIIGIQNVISACEKIFGDSSFIEVIDSQTASVGIQ